jgi:hypothetical protein
MTVRAREDRRPGFEPAVCMRAIVETAIMAPVTE